MKNIKAIFAKFAGEFKEFLTLTSIAFFHSATKVLTPEFKIKATLCPCLRVNKVLVWKLVWIKQMRTYTI